MPLVSYALDAVLSAAYESSHGPLADYSFVDGQPIDLELAVSNETEPAAVCLVKDNDAAIQLGGEVYAIEVSMILQSCIACLIWHMLAVRQAATAPCHVRSWAKLTNCLKLIAMKVSSSVTQYMNQ